MALRKIKDIIGIILTALAIFFLLSLIFVPLDKSIIYINILFELFLIVLPIYLIAEVYYFVKDIPGRKEGILPKKRKSKIRKITEWAFFISLIIILLLARSGAILQKDCPETIHGNQNAEMTIKYFFNPFCPKCWEQEAVMHDIFNEYRDYILLERYDQRYCGKELQQYNLMMVPTLIFEHNGTIEKFGPLSHKTMSEIICEGVDCKK